MDLKSKKKIAEIKNDDVVLSVGFDEEERYILIGDMKGTIKLYNIGALKTVLKVKYIESILDVDIDDEVIMGGCYNKSVIFVDRINGVKKEKKLHIKEVKKVNTNYYCVSSDKSSRIVKWDKLEYDKKDSISFYKEFRDFFINENILIILTNKNIALYDLEKEVVLNDNFIEIKEGDKLAFIDRYIVVADIKGKLYYRDVLKEEKEFLDYILQKNFKKAYELIDKNPFLKRSKGYEKLEKMVELIIKTAKEYFEKDPLKGKLYLKELLEVPFLKPKIEKIIKDYTNLVKFKKAVLDNNFALAYQLVRLYPSLKETKYYLLLEKKWEIYLDKTLDLLKKGKLNEAKEVLKPFFAVPEKLEIINFILKKYEIVFLLREKLAKRDFKGFFSLIKMHPELKNTREYKKVMEYANNLYKKALEFIKNEKFDKAKKAATILLDFPDFEIKAKEILKRVEISLKFLALINTNLKEALHLVELYPFLKELKAYKEFLKKRNKDFYEAEVDNEKVKELDFYKEVYEKKIKSLY